MRLTPQKLEGYAKTRGRRMVKIAQSSIAFDWSTRVTDGQTGGRTDGLMDRRTGDSIGL